VGIKIATSALLFIFATSLFIGWDMRRLSSTLALPANDSGSPAENGQRYLRANEIAPEKVQAAYSLHKAYFQQSNSTFAEGRFEESRQALLTSREMWLNINRHDPYDYSSQMALAKIAFTLFERGASEYADEAITRYEKIAARFPNYPTLVGTAATVAASTENYTTAISLANQAIETEATTKPWSKAWFARGISLYLTGNEQGGIDDLLMATQKEPGSQAAQLAHLALVKIYTDAGDSEAAEAHREQFVP
jgi:tetratricopeptide (TPR) repeat protein